MWCIAWYWVWFCQFIGWSWNNWSSKGHLYFGTTVLSPKISIVLNVWDLVWHTLSRTSLNHPPFLTWVWSWKLSKTCFLHMVLHSHVPLVGECMSRLLYKATEIRMTNFWRKWSGNMVKWRLPNGDSFEFLALLQVTDIVCEICCWAGSQYKGNETKYALRSRQMFGQKQVNFPPNVLVCNCNTVSGMMFEKLSHWAIVQVFSTIQAKTMAKHFFNFCSDSLQ